jgi:hypothetical protein
VKVYQLNVRSKRPLPAIRQGTFFDDSTATIASATGAYAFRDATDGVSLTQPHGCGFLTESMPQRSDLLFS